MSAIPEKLSDSLNLQLTEASCGLKGAGGAKLQAKGQCLVDISHKDNSCKEVIYVVKDLVTPLLGKPALKKLNVINFIEEVSSMENWKEQYPQLFKGLGTMKLKSILS